MNSREKALIRGKNDEIQKFIKSQHRLPKDQRDERRLKAARTKAKVYKRWLDE